MLLKILLMATVAHASDLGKFTALEYKAPAPFAGILFDEDALAKIMSDYDVAVYSCETETKYQVDITKEEYEFKLQNLIIEHKALTEEYDLFIKQKDKEIKTLSLSLQKTSPRYKWYWFVGGVVVGSAGAYNVYRMVNEQ